MSFEQSTVVAILVAMLLAFASERLRVELVAMAGLAAGFATGVVPVQQVFSGFANPAVITVIEVLLVVGVLSRTRLMDGVARRITAVVSDGRLVVLVLCSIGAFVSVFMNNIGALALVFPVAISVCAQLSMSPAKVLMPLSFATLLGGMCSLTGTPANLVVNDWVVSQTGRSLAYFELGIVGFPLVLAGLLFLAVTSHRLFARFGDGDAEPWEAGSQEFIVERQVTAGSELVGVRAPEFERKFASTLHAVIRNNQHVFARHQDIMIASGDVLLIQSQLGTIYELEEDGALAPLDLDGVATDTATEFVVMPDSLLIGSRVEDVQYQARGNCQVTALASRRVRVEGRFRDLQLGMGDLLMVAGEREDLRSLASDCGLMALSPRRNTQATRQAARAIAVFSAGVLASAFEIAPTEIAFGAVVLAMAVMGQLNLRAALQDTNWTIVILLACMIPLGMAVEETGAARVIADGIAGWLPTSDPLLVVVMMLALATAITPFIDNVSTAVVLSPIAAGLATRTGTPVEPLLMAVAIGASMDFLTPFGHHNNSVVMGAGGYRFLDFPRLGLPLVVLCMAIATIVFALILRA